MLVKCEWQKAQSCKSLKKIANFKENGTYIANIFHAKKYGEIGL